MRQQETIDFFEKEGAKIDLVVLDMAMLQMNGKKCYRGLRNLNPGVKAVLPTGHGFRSAAREMLDERFQGYPQKRFNICGLSEIEAGVRCKYPQESDSIAGHCLTGGVYARFHLKLL